MAGLLDYMPALRALSYGQRLDGTQKGNGWLGPLTTGDGDTMTEVSIGSPNDPNEPFMPLITPNQSFKDMNGLLMQDKITDEMRRKAYEHYLMRMNQGLSPFKD